MPQQYLVTIDPTVDPTATAEVLNVIAADGSQIGTFPVDITATQTIFQVDDPSTLVGATCVLVDSNGAGAGPASSPVAVPPVPPPPVPPKFSRQILTITPVTAGGFARPALARFADPLKTP